MKKKKKTRVEILELPKSREIRRLNCTPLHLLRQPNKLANTLTRNHVHLPDEFARCHPCTSGWGIWVSSLHLPENHSAAAVKWPPLRTLRSGSSVCRSCWRSLWRWYCTVQFWKSKRTEENEIKWCAFGNQSFYSKSWEFRGWRKRNNSKQPSLFVSLLNV